MKFIIATCAYCGVTLAVEKGKEIAVCRNCGTENRIRETKKNVESLSPIIYIFNDFTEESVSLDFDKFDSVFNDFEGEDSNLEYSEDEFDDDDDFP